MQSVYFYYIFLSSTLSVMNTYKFLYLHFSYIYRVFCHSKVDIMTTESFID